MVIATTHGGRCCGARHLYQFGTNEEQRPDLINAAFEGIPPQRMVEVILNGTQMNSYPNILRRLADLGFVMVSHYTNDNHNSSNYVFHRCGARRPLGHANWTGMVITPTLNGPLPAVPEARAAAGNARQRYDPRYVTPLPTGARQAGGVQFARGQIVEINSPTSVYHGQRATIVTIGYDRVTLRLVNGPENTFRLAIGSVRRIDANQPTQSPLIHADAIGLRVQYTAEGDRPRGAWGTVISFNHGSERYIVNWDNPDDGYPALPYGRNYLFFHMMATAIPRIIPLPAPPAPEPIVPHRHVDRGDFVQPRAIVAPAPAAAPPVPTFRPETVVFCTYHNIYRGGRVGAGYDTFAAARGARAGVGGQTNRRDILNTGVTRWTENVVE